MSQKNNFELISWLLLFVWGEENIVSKFDASRWERKFSIFWQQRERKEDSLIPCTFKFRTKGVTALLADGAIVISISIIVAVVLVKAVVVKGLMIKIWGGVTTVVGIGGINSWANVAFNTACDDVIVEEEEEEEAVEELEEVKTVMVIKEIDIDVVAAELEEVALDCCWPAKAEKIVVEIVAGKEKKKIENLVDEEL